MRPAERLDHDALLYRDQREYLARVTGFARSGLARGEPVLVAVPGSRLDGLRERLGAESAALGYADMTECGRNPARLIPALQASIDRHAGQPVRLITEPAWPGRSLAELREAVRHEALINLAFAGAPVRILCPYAAALGHAVIDDATQTHPAIIHNGLREPSTRYAGAEMLCQVQDQGWITDPLAGRRRRPATEPGHGLWVVNQVCDLVELRSGPPGTTIRLHMNLSGEGGTGSRRGGRVSVRGRP